MEAPEVPLENTQEHIHEHAHESRERWVLGVALSTAVMAAIAAIGSLLAGKHINEGMICQIASSDKWAYYQAKQLKGQIISSRVELLKAMSKEASQEDTDELQKLSKDQKESYDEALKLKKESEEHVEQHEKLAASVSLFQIGIAVSAIAVLTKRRRFWFVGLAFGVAGIVYLALAYV